MLILKRIFFGLCIGLFMFLFRQYVWVLIRPIFIQGQIVSAQKTFLLTTLTLVEVLVAIIGVLYERKKIVGVAKITARKRILQMGLLSMVILIGSLIYSIAFEF